MYVSDFKLKIYDRKGFFCKINFFRIHRSSLELHANEYKIYPSKHLTAIDHHRKWHFAGDPTVVKQCMLTGTSPII